MSVFPRDPIYLGPTCGMWDFVKIALLPLAAVAWIGLRWVAVPWWIHRRHTRLPRRR